jgi:hypothetical protein
MSFREKSAWVMGLVMVVTGLFYLSIAIGTSGGMGRIVPPMTVLVPYVGLVVIASIVAQTTMAILSPREAHAPADERERLVLDRAGNWSGSVLGIGAVTSLLHFLYHGDASLLFHMVMGSLILSQIAEYTLQIALMRRGV